MADDKKGATFSLKVMINKERTKVLFADSDSHFADILLSFLSLPLGRIVKVLEKHYGDEAPSIGSLSSLYRSLVNLDSSYFWTDGAKQTLLDPTSSLEHEYGRLKLDITDFQPAEYFYCIGLYQCSYRFRSVSIYYDHVKKCKFGLCGGTMKIEVVKKGSEAAASRDGVFTMNTSSFLISDDLHIFPSETGLLGVISFLGITDMDNAEQIKVDLGFTEIMNLLKASLTSPTPLSDIILNKTTQLIYSKFMVTQPHTTEEENPNNSRNLSLKVMIQQSTGKVAYAQANKQFVEFLFSFLYIPLVGVEHLLAGNTCVKAIDNLYRSTSDLADSKHFITPDTKKRLMTPILPHGYISAHCIFPLAEECLPAEYNDYLNSSSVKFPNGQGSYLKGSPTYHVADDLTVTPFCFASTLSSLKEQKISISDVKEVEMQIGLKEALSILKASLTSTTALTDALMIRKSLKQPKREV
ncbi:uncharacterized protein LOC131009376 isoform X1 [Salvia miltiorrhiza]|uniref:uncharacterized protein LOC131009370 isoform X1 n=1 Tax=Salvia miltiorrhiza TaxID=226208 RepID=UPI0025AD1CF7|nr:uncharacterized protein LOC131009370 isoform X1 [Salvia miltiorrhiza]XP_057792649.1 uncharacterized protein LOC131009370 isoform X1 [Salvia miltiorrhiza]XP_057792650.1 uncharacterized protein LOC131009370 isoform X1 [Salvia miltiorrhiza]XP_057792662.1 uncharacterized protein LOC131009376 isoform X1 [Salvia miltiorrhiza]XP_057792663.1 uncharacterized protein LOC131009376 isoform X1 [Salvia miltiorrhiza]XP_057792664.1 uncharacterized protein LOC131009376 isoform X1 [Salvia miltiorrhiza]XP_05